MKPSAKKDFFRPGKNVMLSLSASLKLWLSGNRDGICLKNMKPGYLT